jgi:hypothetical protein
MQKASVAVNRGGYHYDGGRNWMDQRKDFMFAGRLKTGKLFFLPEIAEKSLRLYGSNSFANLYLC